MEQKSFEMKIVLLLSVILTFASAAPLVSLIGSPSLVSAFLFTRSLPWVAPVSTAVAPIGHVASPLLAQKTGEAPASTVHAVHVQQVVAPEFIPHVLSYSLPAVAPAHVVSARAKVISAYSLPPVPLVSH